MGSGPVVQVTLAPDGSKALARFTRNHIGRRIRVTAAGRLVSSAVIRDVITGDMLEIASGADMKEAIAQAALLSGGNGTLEVEPIP